MNNCSIQQNLVFKSPTDANYFFGYYDKSQLNASSTRLLAMRVENIDRLPDESDCAVIGYFDLEADGKPFIEVAVTRTFNWQQGCMLQWLGPDFHNKLIFNDLSNGRFVSVVIDINTGSRTEFPMPIYTVSRSGEFALCIDQERHFFCRRSYSYAGVVNCNKDSKVVTGDGIWKLDITNGKITKIIELTEIIGFEPLSIMKGATHYLEHLMLSPSGTRFCFLHRWRMEDGGVYSRLFTSDINGNDIYLLNDSGRVSHFCWRNEQQVLMYGGASNPFNKLRRYKALVKFFFRPLLPLYHKIIDDESALSKKLTGDGYFLLNDLTKYKWQVAEEISSEDGHPSFIPGQLDVFVTDVYPDFGNNSTATLMIYNLVTKSHKVLAKLKSIEKYDATELRCDLHPRCSYDGKYVSVDTMDSGVRGTYMYRINPADLI